MDLDYLRAEDLEHAWLNFELDLPLSPQKNGDPNPFYVQRPGNPASRLERELLLPYRQPPKYFFSGHRGCGKSTELRQLAASPAIQQKYWPLNFSIRDEADINNLDFRDILLAIGGQLFRQYQKSGKKLPEGLIKELDSWRGAIEQETKTILDGRVAESEVGAGLNAFFATASLKMKLEPKTRSELRQVFERNITGLIDVIKKITIGIQSNEGKPPLVLIDDLDKPDLTQAKMIFHDHREVMLQPLCAIVYTVSSSLFYSMEFEAIRDRTKFLPNIKLHAQGDHEAVEEGYATLKTFIDRRMSLDLIEPQAIRLAAQMSGGVFRELCRVMRSAIDRAMTYHRRQIVAEDIEKAAAEVRGEYRRILTPEQLELLKNVHRSNQLGDPPKAAPLLQILALLEYANGEPWWDVHPALVELVG